MKKTDKVFHIHKKTKFKLSSTVKRMILASSASIIVGLLFGAFFLHMIKQEESTASVIENTPTSIESNEELRELAAIEVFVIQGGVFLEKENYQSWESKYDNSGIKTINWERDNTYYLLAGIAETEAMAKEYANKLDELGLDVFVKPWIVSETKLNLSETEYEWLLTFVDVWNESLLALENKTGFPYEAWENLVYEDEKNPQVNELNEVIQQSITKESSNKPELEQHILLHVLNQYEEIIVNN